MSNTSIDQPEPIGASSASDVLWQRVGAHRVRIVNDCVEWVLNGPLSLAELQAIERNQIQVEEKYLYWVSLVDCHNAGGIEAPARRHVAVQARLHPDRVSFSALYGCSLMVMSLSALVVRAASLFSGKPQSVEIFRDEASARFGLAAFRRTLQKTPEGRLIRR